jgi:hypothetical protein
MSPGSSGGISAVIASTDVDAEINSGTFGTLDLLARKVVRDF